MSHKFSISWQPSTKLVNVGHPSTKRLYGTSHHQPSVEEIHALARMYKTLQIHENDGRNTYQTQLVIAAFLSTHSSTGNGSKTPNFPSYLKLWTCWSLGFKSERILHSSQKIEVFVMFHVSVLGYHLDDQCYISKMGWNHHLAMVVRKWSMYFSPTMKSPKRELKPF